MANKYTTGILFLYIACAQMLTQHTVYICKRNQTSTCIKPVSCQQGFVFVTRTETHLLICNSSTRCEFCCNIIRTFNQTTTDQVQQHCASNIACDVGNFVLNLAGVGGAKVDYECRSTYGQTSQSTTASVTVSLQTDGQTSLNHVSAKPILQNSQKVDTDMFPLVEVLVPSLLVLIVAVVVCVVIVIRPCKQKISAETNYDECIVLSDRSKQKDVVVNTIYDNSTAPLTTHGDLSHLSNHVTHNDVNPL